MKKTKKILSLMLAMLMLLSIAPMAYAGGNTYKVGDIIQFGSYPQSKVTDSTTITDLNSLAPAWDNWTSYGYYSGAGSDGTMQQGDWMRYTDIMYNGNKYRGVKFTQYRPDFTYGVSTSHSAGNTYQKLNGYYVNTVYWFKFEPVDWRVLNPDTGLVMCEALIDSQPYSNTIYYNSVAIDPNNFAHFNDSSYTNYASDYETSSIRNWLNNNFYNTTFTDSEKKEINTTTLNNYGYHTLTNSLHEGFEKLDGNPTNDKIFLLSYNEVRNSNYGFNTSSSYYVPERYAKGSDYAQSQGLYVYEDSGNACNNNSSWLLRSPGFVSYYCCNISVFGGCVENCNVSSNGSGVRPALCFKDIENYKHQHSYSATTTPPTCTDKGYTVYGCSCGDSYVDSYVNAYGHKDDNSDYKCDYGCGYTFENPAESCSCNCHKGGLAGLFFKIINFFQKLLGKNKVCVCGAAH